MDEDIGWNDFDLRNYDAQIGRWVQMDPYGQYPSPYMGMGNDPMNGIDPDGGLYGLTSLELRLGTSIVGFVTGAIVASTQEHPTAGSVWGSAFAGAGIGFLATRGISGFITILNGAGKVGQTVLQATMLKSINGQIETARSGAESIAQRVPQQIITTGRETPSIPETVTPKNLPNPVTINPNVGGVTPSTLFFTQTTANSSSSTQTLAQKTSLKQQSLPKNSPMAKQVSGYSFNIDNAISTLDANAKATPQHRCARFVRIALEAGGINTSNHPINAREYGPYLRKWGFNNISPTNYDPTKGDIRVFQPYSGGNPAGHIDMYNGNQWESDFREKHAFPGPGYANNPKYEIFRWHQ